MILSEMKSTPLSMNIDLDLLERAMDSLNPTCVEKVFSMPRIENSSYFEYAQISTALVPQVEQELNEGDKPDVFIVGNDGYYLSSAHDDNLWPVGLKDLMKRGSNVTYFLTSPTEESLVTFRKLCLDAKSQNLPGSFRVITIDDSEKNQPLPKDVKHAIDTWETHHFAVFKEPNLLWLEGCHEPNSTTAIDCQFLGRDASKGSYAWELYHDASEKIRPFTKVVVE